MVCKSALTTLSIALTVGAQEGISLLQTQAHLHTQKDDYPSLPEPKRQSATPQGEVTMMRTHETDFECAGGKGNWVYMNSSPKGEGSTDGREQVDLSEKTLDIIDITMQNGMLRARSGNRCPECEGEDPRTYTEHGRVKNEKDCYARAKMDMRCNHWAEDLAYPHIKPVLGVWYGGTGLVVGGTSHKFECMCAKAEINAQDQAQVGNKDKDGMWFCQFSGGDRVTPEQLEQGLGKEKKDKGDKKTKEEREACKNAKAETKSARAALKVLRAKFRADLKAAKEALAAKKGLRSEVC